MEQYIDKSALVAEIEKRLHKYEKEYEELARYEIWGTAMEIRPKIEELKNFRSFLDTLEVKEEQEEPVSEDLEKASIKYAQDKYMPVQTSQAFKAGAQWQKEQMIDKAFKYINYQLNLPSDFEQHFRKAMEE